jgi:hypothetical protein
MTEYTYAGFYQTTMESDELTTAELKASYLVLTMFLVLWTMGSLFLVEDLRLTGNWFVAPKARVERRKNNTVLLGNAIVPSGESKEIHKKYLYAYLNSIFPNVFRQEGSTWRGLMRAMLKHHRYIAIIRNGETDSHELRVKTVLQLLTVHTMLMFVLALCYDLQYPSDDGYCGSASTEEACLKPASMFDSSQPMCEWVVSSSTNGDQSISTESCVYLKPKITLHMIALISILVSTMTAPFNLLVDFLFDVIRAPTADSDRLSELISSGNTSIQRAGRRMSAVAIGAKKAIVSRVNNMIPVRSSGKSTIKYVTDALVRDVTRDVPDFVVHRHALASKAVGESLRQHSIIRVKPKEETMQPRSFFLGRKQRATVFLSNSHPTPPIDITVSTKEVVPFNAIAPTSPASELKLSKEQSLKAMFDSLLLELDGEYNQLTAVAQREEFIAKWG